MKINVLISTIDSGIDKIADILLTQRMDVEYIISHQYRDDKYLPVPRELDREDVTISQIAGQGVTKSRNNAIRQATGDVCVLSDDDVRYSNEYFDTILDVYENHDIDLACFKIFTGEGQPSYKNYPGQETVLTSLKGHYPSGLEITFRLKPIMEKGILFDERFGLGSWLCTGGENLFLIDAIQSGLKIKFFPKYIVKHPFESTIKSFPKYAQRRVRVGGAFDARINGHLAILKAFAGTIKILPDLLRQQKNPISYLYDRLSGVFYILRS